MKHQRVDLGRPWSAQQALLNKHIEADMLLWDISMLLTRIRIQFYTHSAIMWSLGFISGAALAHAILT